MLLECKAQGNSQLVHFIIPNAYKIQCLKRVDGGAEVSDNIQCILSDDFKGIGTENQINGIVLLIFFWNIYRTIIIIKFNLIIFNYLVVRRK